MKAIKKLAWKQLPADWLPLFCAVFAAMRCLQTSYTFLATGLFFWCLLCTGVLCLLFRLPRPWLIALGGLVLLLFGCLFFRRSIYPSFLYMLRTIIGRVAGAYAWLGGIFSVQPPTEPADVTAAFLALASLLSLLVCASVVWLHTALPATLFCVATILPCFFLTDTPPQIADLVLLTASILVLAYSQGVRSRFPEEAGQATLFALLPAVLIVGLTLLLFPEKSYQPPLKLEDLTSQLVEFGEGIGSSLHVSGSGAEQVDLRALGDKRQGHYEALRVTVDGQMRGLMYLRGMAYEGFDGAHWTVTDGAQADGALLTHAWTSDRTADVSIWTSSLRAVLYTPSYLVAPDVPTVFDYYVPNDAKSRSYVFRMYLPYDDGYVYTAPSAEKLALLTADAQENCLYLPESTRQSLQAIAAQNGLQTAASLDALVNNVIDFVASRANYSLSPPRVPADADFCTWFLTEAGSGYCVHFASAATAMLRAVGVPARYVEGYVTSTQAGEETVVEERQAHAWVEVFYAGEGWRQFDPTPSSGIADSARPRGRADEETSTDVGEESQTPTETNSGPNGSENPTEQPTLPQAPTPSDGTLPAPKKPVSGWVWALLSLLMLAGTAVLLRVFRRAHWQNRLAKAKGNRLALLYWKRYEALCRALKTLPEASYRDLAKKAHFSQHELTEEELAVLADAARRQALGLRTLPMPKQLLYRYWFV